jgi:hypothetical protein
MTDLDLGDFIEVIDRRYASYPMRGTILELDADDPFDAALARIRVNSTVEPAPEIWVNLRLARKVS